MEFNELIGMISRENMEKMFRVNVYGTIEMIQAVSRIMSRNENGGSIINIGSYMGILGANDMLYRGTDMPQVVDLPLVPVTTTLSIPSDVASRMLPANFMATLPGMAVPPRPLFLSADLVSLQAAVDRTTLILFGLDIS